MENTKNKIGIILFLIILLIFVVGGYFAMQYLSDDKNLNKDSKNNESIDLRVDKSKDYVYYENSKDIIAGEEIVKEDVVFNFKDLTDVNNELKKENEEIFNSIKYTKDMDLPKTDDKGNEISYNENDEGIYSLNYREYVDYKYSNYVSLVVEDYSYNIEKGAVPLGLKSYIVDINTGKIITEEELLTKYEITKDIIKSKVKERLENTQTLADEDTVAAIDIEETLNNLDTYAIYINKNGKLEITFVVKSSQNNYNDNVELN